MSASSDMLVAAAVRGKPQVLVLVFIVGRRAVIQSCLSRAPGTMDMEDTQVSSECQDCHVLTPPSLSLALM